MKKALGSMRVALKSFAHIIRPRIEIGGLDISDGKLVFVSIHPESNKITQVSNKIPDGVIEGGVIKDAQAFSKALEELHKSITTKKKKYIPIVAIISDGNSYTQTITLPMLSGKALNEAADLNMQMISPVEYEKTYHDWEIIEKPQSPSGEIDVVASFIEKGIIDALCVALKKAYFIPIAVEQRTVSCARCINQLTDTSPNAPYGLLHVGGDGVSFALVRWGHVFFTNTILWNSFTHNQNSREISFSDFSTTLIQGMQRVLNYYTSRSPDPLSTLFLVAPGLESNIIEMLSKHLSFPIQSVTLKEYELEKDAFVALGGALRGKLPRSKDTHMSLAPQGTEIEFAHSQVISFISLWKEIVALMCAVVLVAGTITFAFLRTLAYENAKSLAAISLGQNMQELRDKKEEAQQFNMHIDRALKAKSEQTRWAGIISAIYQKAGTNVRIDRFYAQSITLPVLINGRAQSEQSALEFKAALALLPELKNIDLPVTSITKTEDGRVSFRLSFLVNR